jgi:hypothetical protein
MGPYNAEIAKPDKIKAFIKWMQEELQRLPEEANFHDPPLHNDLVQKMINKMVQLDFTKDDGEYIKGLFAIAIKLVDDEPSSLH